MFLEKCGVNTVRRMFNWTVVATISVLLVIIACSEKQEPAEVGVEAEAEVAAVTKKEPVTFEDSIDLIINEAMARLRYGDKTGIYRLEFEYLTKQTSYDDYLKLRQVVQSKNDTLTRLEVTSFNKFEDDSAWIYLNVHFDGPTGQHTTLPDSILMYNHKGRWIKPTASTLKGQLDWEKSLKEGGSSNR